MINYDIYFENVRENIKQVYLHDNRPWLIGYSGGKDSTLLLYLVFEVVSSLPEHLRTKKIYAVTSDTMVENPIIKRFMHKSSALINKCSNSKKLNIESRLIYPEADNTFWSKIIGNGYPTPEPPGFRWCTDRLKIKPMNKFVNEIINNDGEVVILLGVRKGESELRKRNISKREIEGKLLIPHTDIRKAYMFNPLTEIPNEVVWSFLLKNDSMTPWGVDTKFLFNLYQGEDFDEEQSFIAELDEKKVSSTGNSRFGCWCCTIVKQDKSLNSFIEKGSEELVPLRDFRKFLFEIRSSREYRDNKRANGTYYTNSKGEEGLGPFTLAGRYLILKNLLLLQKKTGFELITIEELKYIQEKWETDGDLTKRMLPDLYFEIIGERLSWDEFKQPVFDNEIISEIKKICEDSDIPFELISKLVMCIEKYKHSYKGEKLKKEFLRLLSQDWVHKDAIEGGTEDEN